MPHLLEQRACQCNKARLCGDAAAGAAGDFTIAGGTPSYAPDLRLEPQHTELHLRFDLARRECEGAALLRVGANDPTARALQLNAINFLNVSVEDVEGHPLDWSYDGKVISVAWEAPFGGEGESAARPTRTLRVGYLLRSPVSGLFFSAPDERQPERPLYAVTDNETERARYWFPCVDYPVVRTSLDIHLTSEAHHDLFANGLLVSEKVDEASKKKTAHWRLEQPCPSYLACVCVGEFVVVKDGDVNGIEIAYIGVKGVKEEDLRRSFGKTPQMMRWLTSKLELDFPFPKYYQFICPIKGGAMENITLTTWGDVFLVDEGLSEEWQYVVDSINIHEMSHSFFGDALVIRHFEHAWLKESWATYFESLWFQENSPSSTSTSSPLLPMEFQWEMFQNAEQYMRECNEQYVRPIVTNTYDSSWNLFDAHTYPGGCWRLHMLRHLMGDASFWGGVRAYLRDNLYSVVETTTHFKAALERKLFSGGKNLTRFFDQWITNGRGYPQLTGEFRYDLATKQLFISFAQTQKDESKKIGLFDFELEVEVVESNSGKTHLLKVDIASGRSQNFVSLQLENKPSIVRFDPQMKVLFSLQAMNGLGEDILGNTFLHPETNLGNQLWTANELIKRGNKACFELLHRSGLFSASSSHFYGVRVQVAKYLAAKNSEDSIEALAALLRNESDPRAFAGLFLAVVHHNLRDERIRQSILSFLSEEGEKKKDTHHFKRGRWAALQALGVQGKSEDFALLLEDSFYPQQQQQHPHLRPYDSFIRIGALRGLAKLAASTASDEKTKQQVLEALSQRIGASNPDDTRPAAIEAFAQAAASQASQQEEKKRMAVEQLIALLRDPLLRVRKAAVTGLVVLKAGPGRAAEAVSAVASEIAEQDLPWLERQVKSLRASSSGGGEEVKDLRKQVEELQARLRKLEGKVEASEEEKQKSK
ncbi:Peptidase family m1 domain containing protein [Balamuthia mandrillaris]